MSDDLAEIRAEGRRLREALWWTDPESEEGLAATATWSEWLEDHADALLADPAPEGLSEEERRWTAMVREDAQCFDPQPGSSEYAVLCHLFTALDLLDRLSASPEEGTDG